MLFCCFSRTQVHFRAVTVEGFFPNGSQNTTVDPAHAQRTVQRKTPSLPLRRRSIVVVGHVRRSRVVHDRKEKRGAYMGKRENLSMCPKYRAGKGALPTCGHEKKKGKVAFGKRRGNGGVESDPLGERDFLPFPIPSGIGGAWK